MERLRPFFPKNHGKPRSMIAGCLAGSSSSTGTDCDGVVRASDRDRRSRNEPVSYIKRRYRRCSRIEIMFGRPSDWHRLATRYDRCPTVFFSAVALAATVIFWL